MTAAKIPVIGFAAFSGTGKTTLVTRVIPILRERGLNIGVIKHAHHDFVIDKPGKDSYEIRKAGAQQILIASRHRIAWVKEKEDQQDPQLSETLEFFSRQDLNLIVVEGYKNEAFTKIEVHRAKIKRPLLAKSDPNVIAIATDSPDSLSLDVTLLGLEDYDAIAQFIIARIEDNTLTQIDRT